MKQRHPAFAPARGRWRWQERLVFASSLLRQNCRLCCLSSLGNKVLYLGVAGKSLSFTETENGGYEYCSFKEANESSNSPHPRQKNGQKGGFAQPLLVASVLNRFSCSSCCRGKLRESLSPWFAGFCFHRRQHLGQIDSPDQFSPSPSPVLSSFSSPPLLQVLTSRALRPYCQRYSHSIGGSVPGTFLMLPTIL